MDHTKEISDFKHGTVIRCHLCHKSDCETSALLDLCQSTVSSQLYNCEMEAQRSNTTSPTKW